MYYIIFNPTAGAGRSAKVLSLVEQRFSGIKKAVSYGPDRISGARAKTREKCSR